MLKKNETLKKVEYYFIQRNFGEEKIWRNWRFRSEIAKLSPRKIKIFFSISELNPRQIAFDIIIDDKEE